MFFLKKNAKRHTHDIIFFYIDKKLSFSSSKLNFYKSTFSESYFAEKLKLKKLFISAEEVVI